MNAELKTRPDHVLEDPGTAAVAGLYGRSYLLGVKDDERAGAAEELSSFVDDVLEPNPELDKLFTSGSVSRDQKLAMIDRVVAPHCSEYFANFLRVLTRHGRTELVRTIRAIVVQEQEVHSGQQRISIRSARPLTDAARDQVRSAVQQKFGFQPILMESVDESLIGGIVIQVGDTVYDSSLRTRMKQLSSRLLEKTLNEIQSGRDRFSHPEGD